MNYKYKLEKHPSPKALLNYFIGGKRKPFKNKAEYFSYSGSGKAAIASILDYLRMTGVLTNKMSPILVPKWLGIDVYKTILEYGFPVYEGNAKAKVLIAYHQWGFPQNMDKIIDYSSSRKMVLIEDCAHGLNSYYKGQRLGAMGDFGIYSFSKFCFCLSLGGVSTKHSSFIDYYNKKLDSSSKTLSSIINFIKLYDTSKATILSRVFPYKNYTYGLTKMAYSRYGDSPYWSKGSVRMLEYQYHQEVGRRKEIYKYVRDIFDSYGLCDHLEYDSVTPYAIPLMLSGDIMDGIIKELRQKGFETNKYYFDMNRFTPEPNFKQTLLIPCHSGLSNSNVQMMIDTILESL